MGLSRRQTAAGNAEYAVYTFGGHGQERRPLGLWEKKATHPVIATALKQAEELYKTEQYHKVEIKQKYFDPRCNRNIDRTLRTLGQKNSQGVRAAAVVAFASVCGLAAFAVTYFLLYGG